MHKMLQLGAHRVVSMKRQGESSAPSTHLVYCRRQEWRCLHVSPSGLYMLIVSTRLSGNLYDGRGGVERIPPSR